jgi:hypothetical protein
VLNRSFSAPFGTPLGELVLAVIAVLYIVGLSWLARLGNIGAPTRFLARDPGPATAPASSAPASHERVAR